MKKSVNQYIDLPLEEGKTYTTKFATVERFTITKIPDTKGKKLNTVYGIYEKSPHVGECPLDVNRIIHDKQFIEAIYVCHKCGEPIEEHEQHYKPH